MKKTILILVAACTFLFVNDTSATLLGYNVSGEKGFNTTGGPYDSGYSIFGSPISATIIDPGIEMPSTNFGFTYMSVDFNDTGLSAEGLQTTLIYSGFPFNGFVFHFLDSGFPGINNVTLASTTISGFDAGRISFQSNTLAYNLGGLWVRDGDELNIAISTAEPTPEPTTMLLLGTGLVGVAGAARRKKKNQA